MNPLNPLNLEPFEPPELLNLLNLLDTEKMTDDNARRVANALMAAAAVGVGYFVVRTPPLRRAAWRLLVIAVTSGVPAWLTAEVRRAWAESGAARPHDMIGG